MCAVGKTSMNEKKIKSAPFPHKAADFFPLLEYFFQAEARQL